MGCVVLKFRNPLNFLWGKKKNCPIENGGREIKRVFLRDTAKVGGGPSKGFFIWTIVINAKTGKGGDTRRAPGGFEAKTRRCKPRRKVTR